MHGGKRVNSGRKPGRKGKGADQKKQDALEELFFKNLNKAKIEKKIQSGKFTGLDMMKYKVVNGDKDTILKTFSKIIPDSIVADIESRSQFDSIKLDK